MGIDVDPADGLLLSDVGEWAQEKHRYLANYVGITSATRKKFPFTSYIELFAGAGRARIRETGGIIDGSPVVAVKSSVAKKVPYIDLHLGDADKVALDACAQRLKRTPARFYTGPSHETVGRIVDNLNPHGYHFAFLDPFNVEMLPYAVISRLSAIKHMDMLIHVSVMDIQRNLPKYLKSSAPCDFDVFAPGWRDHVPKKATKGAMLRNFMNHWTTLIARLDMRVSSTPKVVKNRRNRTLYWLVMVSRNPLADKFWQKLLALERQRGLF